MSQRRRAPVPKPTVMIFADASVCVKTGAAGWGAWIKADGQTSCTAGQAFETPVRVAAVAEAMALANALSVAKSRGFLAEGAIVMLQSDCLQVLAAIRRAWPPVMDNPAAGGLSVGPLKKPATKAIEKVVKALLQIAQDAGALVQVRHVKGHSAGTGRNWVNRTCDKIAKKAMRERRAALTPDEQVAA